MNAVIGIGLVGYVVVLRLYLAKLLRKQGRPASLAWRGAWWNPMAVVGVLFILLSVSETAATIYFGLVLLGCLVFIVWLVITGVRTAPEMWRKIRTLRDPEAWRGN
ncbi:MAG: hypothetical protein QOI61_2172 [Actinomycetota bacterium]|jgi:hypothetical protein